MKVAIFWRSFRNVELQKRFTEENIFDDAREEAALHAKAVEEAGHEAVLLQWTGDALSMLKELIQRNIDMVFNASSTDELYFLETFHIPYTGTRVKTVETDKALRKLLAAHAGVPTPQFVVAKSKAEIPDTAHMQYPLFVKPLSGRGSAGIGPENVIDEAATLPTVVAKITEGVQQPALIEEFIEGKEISVGVLGSGDEREILPILEIEYSFGRTNTYEHKNLDQEIFHCPARIGEDETTRLQQMSHIVCEVLEIEEYGRLDWILRADGTPYFLEVNTFPGMVMPSEQESKTAHYGYMGIMAHTAGYSRGEFVGKILENAAKRWGISV